MPNLDQIILKRFNNSQLVHSFLHLFVKEVEAGFEPTNVEFTSGSQHRPHRFIFDGAISKIRFWNKKWAENFSAPQRTTAGCGGHIIKVKVD